MTTRDRFRTGLAPLMALSLLAVAARADEEEIAFNKLPSAVRQAVKKKFPEARIRGAAKEVEDGKTTFEVELTAEGRSVDVALDADGKILEVEKEIPVDKLPRAVKKKVAARFPGAKIEKAEEITEGEDGPVRYEVALKVEVVLTARGKIIPAHEEDEEDDKPAAASKKKEKKEDKDDDDEDDEDDDREVKGKGRAGD